MTTEEIEAYLTKTHQSPGLYPGDASHHGVGRS